MQRQSVRRRDSRRRAQAQKRLKDRYGSDRPICPEAVDLCRNRLTGIGVRLSCRGVRELFFFLQRVLHTNKDGASLPLEKFSSTDLGRKLCDGLTRTGLISCVNPDSWKPRAGDLKNARARQFLPSSELLLANAGPQVVDNAADYLAGCFQNRRTRCESEVILCPGSLVPISAHVVARLREGTGLRFSLNRATNLLIGAPEERRRRQRSRKISVALWSTEVVCSLLTSPVVSAD